MLNPFTPGQTIAVTATGASVATALPTTKGNQVMVSSPGTNGIAFIAFGISTTTVVIPTTATNGTPILPGSIQLFTVPASATHVSVIGTLNNTLYFTAGDGE